VSPTHHPLDKLNTFTLTLTLALTTLLHLSTTTCCYRFHFNSGRQVPLGDS